MTETVDGHEVEINIIRTMDLHYPYSFILTLPGISRSYMFNFPETFGRAMLEHKKICGNEIIGFCNSAAASCVAGILGFGIGRLTDGAEKPFRIVCNERLNIRALKKHSLIRKGRIESIRYLDSIMGQPHNDAPPQIKDSGAHHSIGSDTDKERERDKNTLVNSFDLIHQQGDRYSDEWVEIDIIPSLDGKIVVGYKIGFLTERERQTIQLSKKYGKDFSLKIRPQRIGTITILNPFIRDFPASQMRRSIEDTFKFSPFLQPSSYLTPANNDVHKVFMLDSFINSTTANWLNSMDSSRRIKLYILSTQIQEGEVIFDCQLFNKFINARYKRRGVWDGVMGFSDNNRYLETAGQEGETTSASDNPLFHNSSSSSSLSVTLTHRMSNAPSQGRVRTPFRIRHPYTVCRGGETLSYSVPKITRVLNPLDTSNSLSIISWFDPHDKLRQMSTQEFMNSLRILNVKVDQCPEVPSLANLGGIRESIPFLKYDPSVSSHISPDSDTGHTSNPDSYIGLTGGSGEFPPMNGVGNTISFQDIEENIRKLNHIPLDEELLLRKQPPTTQTQSDSLEYPKVVMLGSGSKATKTRSFTSFLLFLSPDYIILIDCGEGTVNQMMQLYHNPEWLGADDLFDSDKIYSVFSNDLSISSVMDKKLNVIYIITHIRAIFITHEHSDHYYGIYSFLEMRTRVADFMFQHNFEQTKSYFIRENITEALPIFYNKEPQLTHMSSSTQTGSKGREKVNHGMKNQTLFSYISDVCTLISDRRCPIVKTRPICIPIDIFNAASPEHKSSSNLPTIGELFAEADRITQYSLELLESSSSSSPSTMSSPSGSSNSTSSLPPMKKAPEHRKPFPDSVSRLLNSVCVSCFENKHTAGSVGYVFGCAGECRPSKCQIPTIFVFSGDCENSLYCHKSLELVRERLTREFSTATHGYSSSSCSDNVKARPYVTLLFHECTLGYRRTLTLDDSSPISLGEDKYILPGGSVQKRRGHASIYDALLSAILLKCDFLILNHLSERLNGIGSSNKIYNAIYNIIDNIKTGRKANVNPIVKELCEAQQISKTIVRLIAGLDLMEISRESITNLMELSSKMNSDFRQD